MADQKYSGEPISVEFKDTDLDEVFGYFERISGLNIVVDGAVEGSLTLRLEDVPWDQALEIILRRFRLGYTLEGNVVSVAPLRTLIREDAERRRLEENRALAGETVRVIVRLEHARALAMRDILMSTAVTPRGYLIVDERTNSLVITDLPSAVSQMEEMIGRLDVAAGQGRPEQPGASAAGPSMVVNVQGNLQVAGDGATVVQAEAFQGSAIGRIVGNQLEGSLNLVAQSSGPAELKEALKALHVAVEEMLVQLPAGVNREDVANNLETLTRQATQRRPIKELVKVAGQGLLEAGKTVDAAGKLMDAVRKVATLLGLVSLF